MPNTFQAQLPEVRPLGQAMRESAEVATGKYGFTVINNTQFQTPANKRIWSAISFVTAGVIIDADFGSNPPDGQNLAGITFPAGYILYGEFRGIQLSSGTVIAYYGKPSAHA
jgi:hypothetical protein